MPPRAAAVIRLAAVDQPDVVGLAQAVEFDIQAGAKRSERVMVRHGIHSAASADAYAKSGQAAMLRFSVAIDVSTSELIRLLITLESACTARASASTLIVVFRSRGTARYHRGTFPKR